jgi:ABC-type transport system involved in multi-copper enzyme maturation permease subunit
MMAELRAEFLKLTRTRSTYYVIAISLVLEGIFAFWANGVKVEAARLAMPTFLQSQVVDAIGALGLIGGFVAVLLVTQEYRFNTIMYTLASSNRRLKVFLAKFIVLSLFAVVFTAVMAALSPLLVMLGVAIQGGHLSSQHMYYADILWRVFFYGWGYMMAGMVIGFLARNQIAAFAGMLLLPGLIEQLLGLVLKENAIYLPFSALDAVLHPGTGSHVLTVAGAAGVYLIYLALGWAAALALFLRRDAN